MHAARITLDAASIKNTVAGVHHFKSSPPIKGPTTDAN